MIKPKVSENLVDISTSFCYNRPCLLKYQQARKNNDDPQEYLNKVIDGFSPEQKQQWQNMMSSLNQPNNNINTSK